MTVTLCLSRSLVLLNRRPRGSLYWMLAFFIASYQHLLWTPNSIGVQMTPSAWCGFPYHISSISVRSLTQLPLARRTQLNYIIVRRPLDLWNRMFNRHQAEITVMQFRGHSLQVHQSMRVLWDVFFYLVPFHQPISAHAISSHNCH